MDQQHTPRTRSGGESNTLHCLYFPPRPEDSNERPLLGQRVECGNGKKVAVLVLHLRKIQDLHREISHAAALRGLVSIVLSTVPSPHITGTVAGPPLSSVSFYEGLHQTRIPLHLILI